MVSSVSGGLRTLLRVEGLFVLLASVLAYAKSGSGWVTFALLFLAPDLSILAYLAGPRWGAHCYNLVHSYIGPLVLVAAGTYLSAQFAIAGGLIWVAHIGFDRMLGYGLKHTAGFRFTHLGVIGQDGTGA